MEFNNNGYNKLSDEALCRIGGESLGAQIPVRLCAEKAPCEIAEDFILPEYLPEIRKLLRVSAVPSSPSRYLAASSVKLSGTVEYNVIYVGSDGCVYSASLSDEYEMSVPLSCDSDRDPDGALSVLADIEAYDVISRVTGARKLNIRSRLLANVKVVGELYAQCGASISDEAHVQKLIKSCEYFSEVFGENCETEAVDELVFGVGERYISSDCRVFVESVSAFEGYVECRGNVLMRHLAERQGGKLYEITRKIPFSETVEVDGIGSGMPVTAFGRCTAIIKNVSDDGDDESGNAVTVSAHIKLCAKGYRRLNVRYVKDAFSTAFECENETVDIKLPKLYACANKNMTLSETRGIDCLGGAFEANALAVCDATAEASVESVELSESEKYVINGKCRFYVLLLQTNEGEADGSETAEYSSAEVEVPFRYECAESGDAPSVIDICVEAIDPRVRCDGERVDLACEIVLSYELEGREELKTVENTRFGAELEKRRRGYTVCYPDKNDNLWSISKRYKATVSKTARGNGIDVASDADCISLPDGIRYMIV